MGASLGGAGLQDSRSLLPELSIDYIYKNTLGGSKVLKTLYCIFYDNHVVLKVYSKRDNISLEPYYKRAVELCSTFNIELHPNVFAVQNVYQTDKAAFLERPFLAYNLYDRFSTHPFLQKLEKFWFVYQLLQALNQIHNAGVCHGDIKTENILVTSWTWLFLTDFGFYKPTFLPEDNPADFHFFFDAGQRRRCYLAPERFYRPHEQAQGKTHSGFEMSMDIFSAGCVIAEIFLEGEALFDLSQLLKYRSGGYSPKHIIDKIPDKGIRELVTHMTQLNPTKRASASSYLTNWAPKIFPKSFPFFFSFFTQLLKPEFFAPDHKISRILVDYEALLSAAGCLNPQQIEAPVVKPQEEQIEIKKEFSSDLPSKIQKLIIEMKQDAKNSTAAPNIGWINKSLDRVSKALRSVFGKKEDGQSELKKSDELLPLVSLVCSCIRNVRFPQTKLKSIALLYSLGLYVNDSSRLSRVVPYCVAFLQDPSALVRATSLHTLTALLESVKSVSPADANIFSEYILPSLSLLPSDEEELVRISYAKNIVRLASTGQRFLDMAAYAKQVQLKNKSRTGTESTSPQDNYDSELDLLKDSISKVVVDMLCSSGSKVKLALLSDITRLCIFFGNQRVSDFLLPLLITVLNDRDWELRAAFFHDIIGVSVFVGRVCLQNFILPCIEQALFDVEEFVIVSAIHALTSACELGLFDSQILMEEVKKVAPLLCHPSLWLRTSAARFVCAISEAVGPAKAYCFLVPVLKPFLKYELVLVSSSTLLECLHTPMKREVFECALLGRDSHRHSSTAQMEQLIITSNSDIERVRSGSLWMTAHSKTASKTSSIREEQDPALMNVMLDYISHVSTSIKQKLNMWKFESRSSEDQDAENYDRLVEQVQQLSIASLKTVQETHSNASLNKIQQDLYDTLQSLPIQKSKSIREFEGTKRARSEYMAKSVDSPSSEFKNDLRSSIFGAPTQSKSNVKTLSSKQISEKMVKALSLPPEPPALGSLISNTISFSSFYQNHRPPYESRGNSPKSWRPKGVLVADIHEHKSAVNSISVSRDNLFFVSGSDDGLVKIWDCQRVRDQIHHASQVSYTPQQGGRITQVVVCDSTHSVASASSAGNVHVFRVEYANSDVENGIGLNIVRTLDPHEGSILAVEHFNTISESLLAFASRNGSIHGWDLRSKQEAWKMNMSPSYGLLSKLKLGPSQYCLVSGSTRGFIALWDIRFQIPIQFWRHNSHSPISNLTPIEDVSCVPSSSPLAYPTNGPLIWASTEGSSDITAFDAYTSECRQVLRICADQPTTSVAPRSPRGGIRKHKIRTPSTASVTHQSSTSSFTSALHLSHLKSHLNSFSQPFDPFFFSEMKFPDIQSKITINSLLVCPRHFGITASSDGCLRYWGFQDDCYSISSSSRDVNSLVYNARLEGNVAIFDEITTPISIEDSKRIMRSHGPSLPSSHHVDQISDLKAIEFPEKMLISSDNQGIIKLWT